MVRREPHHFPDSTKRYDSRRSRSSVGGLLLCSRQPRSSFSPAGRGADLIACVDVHYGDTGGAKAAIVAFDPWDAATTIEQHVVPIAQVEPYESGAFYKRELPCILAALKMLATMPDVVIVDGHAWLGVGQPGLGARLLEAEPRIRTVVGVAKTCFVGAPATSILRGGSANPLYVDEIGEPVDAPKRIAAMHGPFRIPTMLRLADRLCRDAGARSG